jgi:hypothetical protein
MHGLSPWRLETEICIAQQCIAADPARLRRTGRLNASVSSTVLTADGSRKLGLRRDPG